MRPGAVKAVKAVAVKAVAAEAAVVVVVVVAPRRRRRAAEAVVVAVVVVVAAAVVSNVVVVEDEVADFEFSLKIYIGVVPENPTVRGSMSAKLTQFDCMNRETEYLNRC